LACGLALAVLVDGFDARPPFVRTGDAVADASASVVAAVIWRLIYNPQFGLVNGNSASFGLVYGWF